MRIDWTSGADEKQHHATISGENVEFRSVFNGATFVTEDGERLSVCMRDSGFEVHYYADFGELGFDGGWWRFNAGVINPPGKFQDVPEEGYNTPWETGLESKRLEAWNRASSIVDDIVADNPLEAYSVSDSVFVTNGKVDLTMRVADWLLGENDG